MHHIAQGGGYHFKWKSCPAKNVRDFLGQLRSHRRVKSAKQLEEYSIMGNKSFVIALAVFAFGFGSALLSNAGTDMIEPYRAPAPGL